MTQLLFALLVVSLLPDSSASAAGGSSRAALVDGRTKMEVMDVIATEDSQFVVILRSSTPPTRYLPIWIGPMEALTIRMKLDRQRPPRPLTLNLLETVLRTGRIRLLEIAIDDVKSGVFLGKVRLEQDGRKWEVDARPSDAIGLAVGRAAPIWVATEVLENAGFDTEDIEQYREKNEGEGQGATRYEETL